MQTGRAGHLYFKENFTKTLRFAQILGISYEQAEGRFFMYVTIILSLYMQIFTDQYNLRTSGVRIPKMINQGSF